MLKNLPPTVLLLLASTTAAQEPVTVRWLGGEAPDVATSVSWGIPWPRGAVSETQGFTLTTPAGETLPVQSWPLAYWPDGSIKWSGHAAVAGPGSPAELTVAPTPGRPRAPEAMVRVVDRGEAYEVDTGPLQVRIAKRGANLVESMTVDGRVVARSGRLEMIDQHGPDEDPLVPPMRERFTSRVDSVTVEQDGPVRAVVRIRGVHGTATGSRTWLPFDVRLYFGAGTTPVRMVHSIIYDGDQNQDFIRGMGVVFDVPMREQIHNRHVRFGGEGGGLWTEPIQPLTGRAALIHEGANVYPDQLAGRRVPNREAYNPRGQKLLDDWAVWSDFKLVQPSADGFAILKRTGPAGAWISSNAGERASGLAFVGDVSGGLGVSLRNFWQSHPTALEIRGAAGEAAELRIWLWSPEAPAMDMRHYDTVGHDLLSSYEDWQEGFSTPYGIARTSELTLYPSGEVPTDEVLAAQAEMGNDPPVLVASPEYLHGVKAFGIWSLPDRSTPGKRWIEEQLEQGIAFYQKEVEQRRWYGFWDFGDVMHSYDAARHVWRYDIGGYAWANTELGPDLWLWYSFLRTGREDVFRMAEAMTRHTSEVDVYHVGRMAGLGTRHNVRHWGDGSKEARESQAIFKRFYHYLTADERTGDLMSEVADADFALLEVDPLRVAYPVSEHPHPYPTRARFGPDWLSFVGNWMTEWERTRNTTYRDKILTGLADIAAMPYGPFSGWAATMGYDPASGHLYYLGSGEFQESSHLATIMGGGEMMFELEGLIDSPHWDDVWLRYARLYAAPREEFRAEFGVDGEERGSNGPPYARLDAYAYVRTGDPKYAERAWGQFLGTGARRRPGGMFASRPVQPPEVLRPLEEVPFISTNDTAQWSLNAIELLEMIGDRLPESHPAWDPAAAPEPTPGSPR
ncbi:MAG TPA: hypothetical protein VFZ18_04715 [Longimicrobiaceae bacterium]